MFSWLEGLVSSIASSIGGVFEGIGDTIVNAIWDNLVKWLFNAFYDSIADVFTQMGDMGAEIFDLSWIEAAVHLFFLFGWVLFGVGVIVAAFDLAVEYLENENCFLDMSSSQKFLGRRRTRELCEIYGADRILFGSDFPMWNPSEEFEMFESLDFPKADFEKMTWHNAERFIGMDIR